MRIRVDQLKAGVHPLLLPLWSRALARFPNSSQKVPRDACVVNSSLAFSRNINHPLRRKSADDTKERMNSEISA